jgi:hypothetical protein
MGEGDPQAVSARLPRAVLQATGGPVGDRHLSLLRYASLCLRRAASKATLRLH